VRLTHPDKAVWPGVTKADYAAYLEAVAPAMLEHVRDRPLTLQRFHGGAAGAGFYQKDAGRSTPDWVPTVEVAKRGGTVRHVVASGRRARDVLVWLAQVNALTVHIAPVRTDRLDRPDRMVIDFDPSGDDDFDAVRRAALAAGELLRADGHETWAMVSGSRGVHVVTPLRRTRDAAAVRAWSEALADELAARDPRHLTTEFHKVKREGRIYVDVARNAPAQTAVAPFSPRARVRPGGGPPIATPVAWAELEDPALRPDGFGMADVLARLP
jgi:bifunctional non-homologous end joining protein LigD